MVRDKDSKTPPEVNPYRLSSDKIKEPPTTFAGRLRYLGPGFILSASIVGSGELIATTRLGAEAGFVTFWIILVSCLVKVAVQVEFGKNAIYSGQSTMEALNDLPGPRFGKASWTIWTWLTLMVLKTMQVGGVIGGTALVLVLVFPQAPVVIWCLVASVAVSIIIQHGRYAPIEKLSLVLIGLFTLLTVFCVVAVQFTPFQFSAEDILGGFGFQLPPEVVLIAIGAFGITGVGGDEILAYNYWLIEKGYAAHTGPYEATAAWTRRAKGWIRVLYLDAVVAMIVYTVTTAAFYLLGAAILYRQGLLPEGMELVNTLSRIYTQSLGDWAGALFLAGAFTVLFSTLFGALAIWTRLFADAFGQIGWFDFKETRVRRKAIGWLAWIIPLVWAALFLLIKLPAMMVAIGGAITTVILLLVVFAVLHFRYRRLPEVLKPGRIYDTLLWISIVSIVMVALYGLFRVF